MKGLATVLLMLLALTGCTGSSDDSSPPPATPSASAEEPPPRPRPGACYRIGLEDATSPTSDAKAVPCTRRHTARTIHVGRILTSSDGEALRVDSRRVQRQLATTCPRVLAGFLGGDASRRALSRFQVVWFSPTIEEYAAGADWFRCDVIALADSERLLPLPGDVRLKGILDDPAALQFFGLCGTAQPGARGFERVACRLRHSWVAISTIPLTGGPRYPGADAVRTAGDEACADQVRSRNDFPLEFSYGWEWPTREQWDAGQRYGFCWAPNDLA